MLARWALYFQHFLEMGSHFFLPPQLGVRAFCFVLPTITGIIDTHRHTQLFSVEMGSCEIFCLGSPGIKTLPISASQAARIASVSQLQVLSKHLFHIYCSK
jgi:hypothetical protein